jgi:hypothetical protein
MRIPMMKQVTWYLIFAMFIIGIVPKVEAGLAPSEVIALAQADRQADLEKIRNAIETKMIRDRLEQYGLTQDEINSRLSAMSDQQVHNFALQLDSVKVGGDGWTILAALLAIAILAVILFYLLGHRVTVR